MNIFVLDLDPETCARYHNNRHVVKMVSEYAQLLSYAHQRLGTWSQGMCKQSKSYAEHPCAKWAAMSPHNYAWLFYLWQCLHEEYCYRYREDSHDCFTNHINDLCFLPGDKDQAIPLVPELSGFALAMPEYLKDYSSAVQSYRNYYMTEKRFYLVRTTLHSMAKWKRRKQPPWWR